MECRQKRQAELFSSGVWPKTQMLQRLANSARAGHRTQVVHQRFSLLRKTQFHEIQKLQVVG